MHPERDGYPKPLPWAILENTILRGFLSYRHIDVLIYIYFESVINVALQFGLVPHEVDGVLVPQIGSVPQSENDENIFALGKVQEGLHVADHRARSVRPSYVTVSVVLGRVVALNVEPNAF